MPQTSPADYFLEAENQWQHFAEPYLEQLTPSASLTSLVEHNYYAQPRANYNGGGNDVCSIDQGLSENDKVHRDALALDQEGNRLRQQIIREKIPAATK